MCLCPSLTRGGVPRGGPLRPKAGPPPGQHEELRQALESQLRAQSPHAPQEGLQLVDEELWRTDGHVDR